MHRAATTAVLFIALCQAALAQRNDFAARYPATLDTSETPRGYPWTCEAADSWALRGFALPLGEKLTIELGPSALVFGKHGTNALWAVITPNEPAPLKSSLTGADERIVAIWLRFHPARVGELFPAATVAGPGKPEACVWATRVSAWKMGGSWQANNRPMIPKRDALTVDIDTVEGKRRFFTVAGALESPKIEYLNAFAERALPQAKAIDSETALKAFDGAWDAFDKEYPLFGLEPKVDWAKARDQFRPRAAAAKTNYEVAAAIAEMLTPLENLHIWVRVGKEALPGYNPERPLNANYKAAAALLGGAPAQNGELAWRRTDDGIGYISVFQLNSVSLPSKFDETLDQLGDTWGLVLDLRYNGGGDESLARKIAGRFADSERIYSTNRFRNGPKHDDMGPLLERKIAPVGPWRYQSPVVVLFGRCTMSSAESFALMMAQCPQVTTMGERTAGSSANPKRIDLPGEITVSVPRWLDMDPDGRPIEHVGVQPQVPIHAKPEMFSAAGDPVLDAALKHLRAAPAADHKPGRRE